MRKFISLFAAMLMVLTASAKIWNVSPTHCETEGDNAQCNIYRTLKADYTFADGDTLLLAGGDYDEPYSIALTKKIVMLAKDGEKPVIKMGGYFQPSKDVKAVGVKFDHTAVADNGYCMYFAAGCTRLEMQNCEFTGFASTCFMSWDTYALDSMIINNCLFNSNPKSIIYDPNGCINNAVITNSTFANNDASSWSAGIIDIRRSESTADKSIVVDHCTFYNNKMTNSDYGEIRPRGITGVVVSNCIFAQPEDYERVATRFSDNGGNGVVRNVITFHYTKRTNQWGHYDGATYTACSMGDPKFKDAANGDFTLLEGSPAIDYAGKDAGGNDITVTLGDPRWAPAPAPALEAPDAAPAAPEWPANQVKAVYSATYGADCGFGEWGSGTVYTQETYGKKYVTTNLGYFGLTFEGDNALNCSSMEKLHLDVWIAADATIHVVPIWKAGGAEKGVTCNLKGQQWNAIDIALTEYDNVTDWSNIYQIKLDEIREKTFWVNNVYFYTTVAPAVDETAPAEFTAAADAASYFSANIKVKATDASGAILYTVKNGEDIVATKNAASAAEAIITVKGLKPNTDYSFSVIAADESGNAAEAIAVATKTLAAPAAAPAPKTYKGLVKSIYSDAYATAPASIGTLNAGWWEPSEMFEGELAAGDKALFYAAKETGMFGWEFAETDMTGYPFLHIDIYPLADGKIKIYPVVNGSTDDYVNIPNVKGGEWNHLVFDLSGKDLTKVFQIGWMEYYTLNGFFLDNVYFSKEKEEVGAADRRINAYGLSVAADGDNYTFSYTANIDGTEANIVFYQNGVEKDAVAIAAPKKGLNQATIAKSDIPKGTNTWAVELKADQVFEFGKLAEGANLMKCHLAIDNSPESDFFGRMYVANRAGKADGGIYVYNQDYTVNTENTLAGQPKWQSMGRPSVGADGTVYIGDWGDAHGGVYVMNPSTLTATCLFEGDQDANGVWTNNGVALGSSTASVGVYGEGANTVLYAMNEDVSSAGTTLYAHGVNVYQLGQQDGSILSKWTVAPTKTFALSDNAAEMFVINATSKGAFFSCSRAKPNNAAGARSLQFYNTKGERTYVALPEGATEDLTGSLGGGCAVSRDEDLLAIVDGDGNILVYSIAWTEDVPALTKVAKYETAFAALGSLCFDFAGNIVVTAGSNYNNSTANKLVAYGVPTENNEVIVPAKKALVVEGTNETTAIDNSFVPAKVEKVILNGQVLIIRDGKTYNMMGQTVK